MFFEPADCSEKKRGKFHMNYVKNAVAVFAALAAIALGTADFGVNGEGASAAVGTTAAGAAIPLSLNWD
ncbi:hypothetical protein [Streptomyces sp. NPDC057939]|uniref:hypothetical protein n=1 Tax=Streptomyces sp. NPDC057939 TaxID=3346284 RepID=UPI0036E56A36